MVLFWHLIGVTGTITSKINDTSNGVYLPISKLYSILAVANLLAHNNVSQICYCGQISLQSAAVNSRFSSTFGGNIYFACIGRFFTTGHLCPHELTSKPALDSSEVGRGNGEVGVQGHQVPPHGAEGEEEGNPEPVHRLAQEPGGPVGGTGGHTVGAMGKGSQKNSQKTSNELTLKFQHSLKLLI